MSSVVTISLAWTGYSAITTAKVFVPCGNWGPAANLTGARGWGELRGKTGNFQGEPAVQVANDVRSPGSATAVGSALTADGVSDPSAPTSVTNATTSKYARPGWLVSLTSGTTLATGSLAGVVELVYG
jgi:hypothetical protein